MKKIIVFLFACIISIFSMNYTAKADEGVLEVPNVKIVIDGKAGTYKAVPIMVNDRTLLPLRELLNNLGVQNENIVWNSSDNSVTINKGTKKIYLKIGDSSANINGSSVKLDVAPVIYNDSTYIPLRFVSSNLDKDVSWSEATSTITIKDKGQSSEVKPTQQQPAVRHDAFAYYESNDALYRVKSDGKNAKKLLSSFDGVKLTPAGNYLYYMYDEKSTTLLRIPMDGTAKIASRFTDDVIYFTTDGSSIYYMNEKGEIYSASADAKKATEAKLVADMADTKNPGFSVISGRIYYNSLKSGRNAWLASKAADGSGERQWIAAGALPSTWFIHEDSANIYFVIDTAPTEKYSSNCMVIYSVSKASGEVTAVNADKPLDTNAVYSGSWLNGYYMYNDGIGEQDYSTANGYVMDMSGNTIKLHDYGIKEIVNFSNDRLVFVAGDGYAYAITVANSEASDKTTLPIMNAGYVRNLMTDGQVRETMMFGQSGAYVLKSDLTFEEMVGIEWDECMYEDDVDGFFYINAGDNGRLYYRNDVAGTNDKLADEKVKRIVLISRY